MVDDETREGKYFKFRRKRAKPWLERLFDEESSRIFFGLKLILEF